VLVRLRHAASAIVNADPVFFGSRINLRQLTVATRGGGKLEISIGRRRREEFAAEVELIATKVDLSARESIQRASS
jgi:hypothetical protein